MAAPFKPLKCGAGAWEEGDTSKKPKLDFEGLQSGPGGGKTLFAQTTILEIVACFCQGYLGSGRESPEKDLGQGRI